MLILLDRDGTLIEERDYLADPKRVKLIPGAAAGLRRLKRAGFKVVVATNQSGVGRGLVSPRELERVNKRFLALLRNKKARLDGVYFCPHDPKDHCACRKPRLGMAIRAAKDLGVSWKKSI